MKHITAYLTRGCQIQSWAFVAPAAAADFLSFLEFGKLHLVNGMDWRTKQVGTPECPLAIKVALFGNWVNCVWKNLWSVVLRCTKYVPPWGLTFLWTSADQFEQKFHKLNGKNVLYGQEAQDITVTIHYSDCSRRFFFLAFLKGAKKESGRIEEADSCSASTKKWRKFKKSFHFSCSV